MDVIKVLFICLILSGCSKSFIYTNITVPYCTEMNNVQSAGKVSNSKIKSLTIPRISGLCATWSSNSIVDAANENDIKTIFYCDRKIFSILGGIYSTDEIIVYGK